MYASGLNGCVRTNTLPEHVKHAKFRYFLPRRGERLDVPTYATSVSRDRDNATRSALPFSRFKPFCLADALDQLSLRYSVRLMDSLRSFSETLILQVF